MAKSLSIGRNMSNIMSKMLKPSFSGLKIQTISGGVDPHTSRQVPTFPAHHFLLRFSFLDDGPSIDRFLKEAVRKKHSSAPRMPILRTEF